jgi:hypothetical protein
MVSTAYKTDHITGLEHLILPLFVLSTTISFFVLHFDQTRNLVAANQHFNNTILSQWLLRPKGKIKEIVELWLKLVSWFRLDWLTYSIIELELEAFFLVKQGSTLLLV